MSPTLQVVLIVSAALFSIGLIAALSRRHAIFILIGIEIMLAAANLNFGGCWLFGSDRQEANEHIVPNPSISHNATVTAVRLAFVIQMYKNVGTNKCDQ